MTLWETYCMVLWVGWRWCLGMGISWIQLVNQVCMREFGLSSRYPLLLGIYQSMWAQLAVFGMCVRDLDFWLMVLNVIKTSAIIFFSFQFMQGSSSPPSRGVLKWAVIDYGICHVFHVHTPLELGSLAVDDSVGGQALREEWKERVKMAQDTISQLEDNIARKTKALQLEDHASADHLANLKKDKWINLQLNIRVLCDQLITKLHAHKFELANLEHAHASRAMDQKTKSHVKKAVKQCAPGIEATVHKYNAKRKEMLKEDAYVPLELVMEGLFNLDVNQDIWENADMVDFKGGEIPLWLANKEVWDGIRVAQEVKSCQEELHQCDVEYSNLCAWMKTWERSLATITIPVGAVDWSRISMPPPVNHPWTCRKALQGIPQLGERDEDGDVSSDDDDGVELEPVAELEDVRFLGDLDRLIGEGDWSEGEGQDNPATENQASQEHTMAPLITAHNCVEIAVLIFLGNSQISFDYSIWELFESNLQFSIIGVKMGGFGINFVLDCHQSIARDGQPNSPIGGLDLFKLKIILECRELQTL
ncbi:hypothetical protein BS47DRAFT_1367378 [Hydnum rufescens UP504]|uniref:Uncharacterized protein n=1 Tax=Hydnum rufescens UP504 TaxID=1448309 RepID=A0A9P6DQ95_9AGAM|nr:hypothetical protein BS47DRAFT_1367378 [Hydnum rufescens UP504]